MNGNAKRSILRRQILIIHRWLGLGAAIFWLVQALTGILIVFHWEITDRTISDIHRPTNVAAIERRIDMLASHSSSSKPTTLWTTAGMSDRYIVTLEDSDGKRSKIRIAGDGAVIDTPTAEDDSVIKFLISVHHNFFGSWGSWIVSISGILLCSNLLLGLLAGWPRPGTSATWRLALKPATRGTATARLYSWHRAVGFWAVLPALIIAGTGTIMKFEVGFSALIGATPVSLPAISRTTQPVGFATAAGTALKAIPGSTLTQVIWPNTEDATYRIRVRAPDEIRRAYGGSVVLVNANNGGIRGIYPIAEAEAARGFMSALFPIHTGEAGGVAGRLLSIAVGLWLITMIIAGTILWIGRRRLRTKTVTKK